MHSEIRFLMFISALNASLNVCQKSFPCDHLFNYCVRNVSSLVRTSSTCNGNCNYNNDEGLGENAIEISSDDETNVKKIATRRHLSADHKEFIIKLHNNLIKKGCGSPIKVTSELLEVPYSSMQTILKNSTSKKKQHPPQLFRRIDENMGVEIKQVMYNMYRDKIVPTAKSLMERLNEVGFEIPYTLQTFRLYLKSIGVYSKTIDQRMAIMETPRLKAIRMEYVSKIRKYREENRNIVYLDETWYDSHDVMKKGLTDGSKYCCLDTPPSRGKRIIILHAGGTNGWVNNALLLSAKNIKDSAADYHEDMNSSLFETWFRGQLLPFLPARSVIVMDNAKYHSKQIVKKPSSATRKADIITYMQANNIEVPAGKITKKELLAILKNLEIPIRYRIDEIAETNGHTVLRLPPYYCIFKPIELVWRTVKRNIRKNNKAPRLSTKIIDVIRNEVSKIGSDLWRNCIKHVVDVENSYVSLEFEEFIINVNSNE